jgi:hypothetical protein
VAGRLLSAAGKATVSELDSMVKGPTQNKDGQKQEIARGAVPRHVRTL